MPDYKFTSHAMTRMSQRAVRDEDVGLVLDFGTQIAPEVWFMRDSDIKREVENLKRKFRQHRRSLKGRKQRLERALKRSIQRLERLRGLKVVAVGDMVVTCYRPSLAHQRRARLSGRMDRV